MFRRSETDPDLKTKQWLRMQYALCGPAESRADREPRSDVLVAVSWRKGAWVLLLTRGDRGLRLRVPTGNLEQLKEIGRIVEERCRELRLGHAPKASWEDLLETGDQDHPWEEYPPLHAMWEDFRVVSSSGWRLHGWAERLVGRRVYENFFEGQYGEFEIEHAQALAAGDVAAARRIVWRYRRQFVITIVGLVPTSAARLIVTLWRLGS